MLAQFFGTWLRLPPGDAIVIPPGHGSLSPALSSVPAERVSSCKQPPKQISAGSDSANTEHQHKRRRCSGASSAPCRQPRGAGKHPFAFTARTRIRPRGKPFPLPKSHSTSFPAAASSSAGDCAAAIFGLMRVRLRAGIAPWSPPAAAVGCCWGKRPSLSSGGLVQRERGVREPVGESTEGLTKHYQSFPASPYCHLQQYPQGFFFPQFK